MYGWRNLRDRGILLAEGIIDSTLVNKGVEE